MKIEETRQSNIYNLQSVARYYGVSKDELIQYYHELLDDEIFLDGLNFKIRETIANKKFTKAIFARGSVDSVDWFAFQRVLLYVLIRYLKPEYCLETGVYYGGNTAFMLNALYRNNKGELVSVDLPDSKIRGLDVNSAEEVRHSRHPMVGESEFYDQSIEPGFIIPEYLKAHWKFIEGSSLDIIPKLPYRFDFYIHDSDHSYEFVICEMNLAIEKMNAAGTLLVDDINWSNAFFKVAVDRKLYPLCLTDNGKMNLDVRTGLLFLSHPNNKIQSVTGTLR